MNRPGHHIGAPFHQAAVINSADNDVRQHDTAGTVSAAAQAKAPMPAGARSRSMSESGGTPSKLLSPSPHIVETSARSSKDDSALVGVIPPAAAAPSLSLSHAHAHARPPVTPRRPSFTRGGLGLHTTHDPSRQFTPPGPSSAASSSSHAGIRPTPTPLSPKLDHAQIYASPTNLLPRRSRGLDFSRAATSLHHSILAEQPSPGSSPLVGGWAMNIPARQGDCGLAPGPGPGPEQSSSSLWSMMGNQERINMSNSLGSNHGGGGGAAAAAAASDMSSSSDDDDDDDLMDEDADGAFVTTPQVSKTSTPGHGSSGCSGPFDSPARTAFPSFSQRQRHRKVPKKKSRGPLGLGLGFNHSAATYSPTNSSVAAAAAARARRESISWQANQLHISSGGETDEPARHASDADAHNGGDSRSVVRRVVTRRGNMLPKSKNFARIRAALAEECSPAEADFMREAEIVKQVRESDMDLEPRHSLSGPSEQTPSGGTIPTIPTAQSSPNLLSHESPMEDISGGDEAMGLGLGMGMGMGMGMGEPALGGAPGLGGFKQQVIKNSKGKKFWDTFSESSSMGGARTPPPAPPAFPGRGSSSGMSEDATMESPSLQSHATFQQNPHAAPPTAAEITRRINNKRRRDDDVFDPSSFKRRAVSPSLSVHGSPVVQSPLQRERERDSVSLGSRPGSTGGDRGSSAHSEAGSAGGGGGGCHGSGNGGGTPALPPSGATGQVNRKARVGLQGMVDTNDGIMRMSIE